VEEDELGELSAASHLCDRPDVNEEVENILVDGTSEGVFMCFQDALAPHGRRHSKVLLGVSLRSVHFAYR